MGRSCGDIAGGGVDQDWVEKSDEEAELEVSSSSDLESTHDVSETRFKRSRQEKPT